MGISASCISAKTLLITAARKVSVCLSVHPSVRLSNEYIVTKPNKDLFRFYTTRKIIQPSFLEKKNGWWGQSFLPKILDQADRTKIWRILTHTLAKRRFSIYFLLVTPQSKQLAKKSFN